MRKSAVCDCLDVLQGYGVDSSRAKGADVGGTDTVFLDDGFAKNPLLQICPDLVFLDKGFNNRVFGGKADQELDFLDLASIQHLRGTFDLVFSFDTLEHVPNPFLFCQNLIHITKPGGYIYVATVFDWPYHPSPEDYFRFSPKGLCELFQNQLNGYKDEFEGIWCSWGTDPRGVSLLGRRR